MRADKFIWNRKFPVNRKGRDFFVGDIHGNFEALFHALMDISFNISADRLFAVGDLINKGPESERCLGLLSEPWFYSVCGNHELMFMQAANKPLMRPQIWEVGGSWTRGLSDEKLHDLADLIQSMTSLSITVSCKKGSVGVVHASCPSDWSELESQPSNPTAASIIWDTSVWSFQQGGAAQSGESLTDIANVDCVVSGHIASNEVVFSGNHIWIDTFSGSGKLSILSDDQLFDLINHKQPGEK